MIKLVFVGLGGFLGSVSRYLAGAWVHRLSGQHWFPWGTLSVNVIGCLLIGCLLGLLENKGGLSEEMHLLVVVGFLGGFTTFSSFGIETLFLSRDNAHLFAIANVLLHILLCLSAAWGGFSLAKMFS